MTITTEYLELNKPIVQEQLQKAAVRLAHVLDTAFGNLDTGRRGQGGPFAYSALWNFDACIAAQLSAGWPRPARHSMHNFSATVAKPVRWSCKANHLLVGCAEMSREFTGISSLLTLLCPRGWIQYARYLHPTAARFCKKGDQCAKR